jgi:hypothetical protein
MRNLLILICSLILTRAAAQQTIAPLKFQSSAYAFDVTTSGKMIIATRVGEVAYTPAIDSLWVLNGPQSNNKGLAAMATIDNVNFFNADTGIISGYIHYNKKTNIIYRTADGGRSWNVVYMGQDGWVDDAVHLENGEAWLSVSGSGIAYTNNYGSTWQQINIPEIRQRFAQIFFNQKHEGLIGSLNNMLAYSTNNGAEWKLLPTPLDQAKYQKTNAEHRPELNKTAIFKDCFIVQQEGLVFWSKKDQIEWHWLKGYRNFYTDAGNSGLYFSTGNGKFIRSETIIDTAAIFDVADIAYRGVCRNGKLFLMCGSKIVVLQPDAPNYSAGIFTRAAIEAREPEYFAFTELGSLGNIGSKIYRQKEFKSEWQYLFELPFTIQEGGILSLKDKNTLLYDDSKDSVRYYDVKNKTVQVKNKQQMLEEFCGTLITNIRFNTGSAGCFHRYNNSRVYSREGLDFEEDADASKTEEKRSALPAGPETIDASAVDAFVKKIPQFAKQQTAIADLGFTESEYALCKKDILKFKAAVDKKAKLNDAGFVLYENNIDFDKLLACVDSVKTIDSSRLNNMLFNLSNMWSTTTNWLGFVLENTDGDILEIRHSGSDFNHYYFPWFIRYNGIGIASTSIEINRFLMQVYPAFIKSNKKMDVLHTLVKRIYSE